MAMRYSKPTAHQDIEKDLLKKCKKMAQIDKTFNDEYNKIFKIMKNI